MGENMYLYPFVQDSFPMILKSWARSTAFSQPKSKEDSRKGPFSILRACACGKYLSVPPVYIAIYLCLQCMHASFDSSSKK